MNNIYKIYNLIKSAEKEEEKKTSPFYKNPWFLAGLTGLGLRGAVEIGSLIKGGVPMSEWPSALGRYFDPGSYYPSKDLVDLDFTFEGLGWQDVTGLNQLKYLLGSK